MKVGHVRTRNLSTVSLFPSRYDSIFSLYFTLFGFIIYNIIGYRMQIFYFGIEI